MPLILTADALRQIYPDAPEAIIAAFISRQDLLAKAGVSETRTRLAYFFSNLGHETGGFTIKDLTENIKYTHDGAARTWKNRFSSGVQVRQLYGASPGWQLKMFDDVYGNRMGNRPGTKDGSRYIGRGGPQITGRDGYREVGKRAGLPLEEHPELATKPEHQPAIACAFWDWKNLNELADDNDFIGCVKAWNGGTNGLPDRERRLAECKAVFASLKEGQPPKVGPVIVGGGAGGAVGGALLYLGVETWIAVLVTIIFAAGIIWLLSKRKS